MIARMMTYITQSEIWAHKPIYMDVAFTETNPSATYHIRTPHRSILPLIKDYIYQASESYEIHSPRPDELLIEVDPMPLEEMHIMTAVPISQERTYFLTLFTTQTCIKKRITEHEPGDFAVELFDTNRVPTDPTELTDLDLTYLKHNFAPPRKNHVKHMYVEVEPVLTISDYPYIPRYISITTFGQTHNYFEFFKPDYTWEYATALHIQTPQDIPELPLETLIIPQGEENWIQQQMNNQNPQVESIVQHIHPIPHINTTPTNAMGT